MEKSLIDLATELLDRLRTECPGSGNPPKPPHCKPPKPPKPPCCPCPEPPPVEATIQTAINLTQPTYYGNTKPFINLLKSATRGMRSGDNDWSYVDPATQWAYAIPPDTYLYGIVQVRDVGGYYNFTQLRAGTYYLATRSPLEITIYGTGIENPRRINPNLMAYDVPATIGSTQANPAINLRVWNNTPSTQGFVPVVENGVEYPALYHADDEAAFLAGETFAPNWVNSLCNPKGFRLMDWTDCPQCGSDNYGKPTLGPTGQVQVQNFYPNDARVFTGSEEHNALMPPRLFGVLARKLQCNVWWTMPAKMSDEALAYSIEQFFAGAGPGWIGKLWSEYNDESWNSAWPWVSQQQYIRDVIAPTIKVVDGAGNPSASPIDMVACGTAHGAIKCWAAFAKHLPRERIVRVLAGQWAWVDGMGPGQFAYVDPVTGQTAGAMADQYAVAPYWGVGEGFTTKQWCADQVWFNPDSWWLDLVKKNIDGMLPQVAANKAFLAQYAPHLKLTCYEGGGWIAADYASGTVTPDTPLSSLQLLDERIRGLTNGPVGREIMQYYWDTLLKPSFSLYNQFISHGWMLGEQQGLVGNQNAPDTPRMALFRTL